jgi:hypothetical protein
MYSELNNEQWINWKYHSVLHPLIWRDMVKEYDLNILTMK